MISPASLSDLPGLYAHVPYCAGKCGYCSFHSRPLGACPGSEPERMTAALLDRARDLAERFGVSGFATAYVGGGTPTALGPGVLGALLRGIARLGGGTPFREWTVEANPESLTSETLRALRDAGVDRISLGFQSGQAEVLRAAGRSAGVSEVSRSALERAGSWGGRLSVDLMIGLPGQEPEGVRADIEQAAAAGAEHLSIYELTVEEGTPLETAVRSGSIRLPSEDLEAELWSAVAETCASGGFRRYEVSNWARPGAECQHNRNYWRGGAWIGTGPSAVSSVPLPDGGTLRIQETRDHDAFLSDAGAFVREEIVPPATAAFEAVMTGFRTREGLDSGAFRARFGRAPEDLLPDTFAKWKALLEAGPRGPAPSDRLLDILNPFLLDCMAEMEDTFDRRARGPGGPV